MSAATKHTELPSPTKQQSTKLNLNPGEVVRVRSMQEIAATLDEHGTLDGVPFMPEMARFCGRKLTVGQRADKTCNGKGEPRRMHDTVHLANLRCNGSAHGGCQAACLMYWKEAWLERAIDANGERPRALDADEDRFVQDFLIPATTRTSSVDPDGLAYQCQATDVEGVSTPLHSLRPDQYVRDLRNWPLSKLARSFAVAVFVFVERVWRKMLPLRLRLDRPWPYFIGSLEPGKTPAATLDLKPGDLVRIKSKDEIIATLDTSNRNRGLSFDVEMTPYCGRTARVLARVERLVDETTGNMLEIKSDRIVLEGIYCKTDYHRFCTRAIYQYWREIWLEKIG